MHSQNDMQVNLVTVVAVQPERADTSRLDFIRANSDSAVEGHYYIVKVYMNEQLRAGAEILRLYVGREEITKYSGFSGGLYFKAYDPQFFEKHAGESFFFSPDGKLFIDTGAKMPAKLAPQPMPEAGMASPVGDVAPVPVLPTKDEVLRR